MDVYRTRTLEGASAVELIVALYDGIIRFLHSAAEAVDRGDVRGRRIAVRRALDIIIHLQATLRTDIGGTAAQALSEFYAATFAEILQASQSASRAKFEHAIHCVRNVREAWKQIALPCADTPARPNSISDVPLEETAASSAKPWSAAHWTA
jgi:flagellar secretion chaperone FliS